MQFCGIQEIINTLLEEMAAAAISAASGTRERAKEANLEKQGSRNFA
jgi:hypothetical protein